MKKFLLSLVSLFMLTLFVQAGEVKIAYAGTATSNMTGENDAALFGLSDDEWSIVGDKGAASNMPGLNAAGNFRIYYHKDGSNTITVTVKKAGAKINKINGISFTGARYSNVTVSVGGELVEEVDGEYIINATSFVLSNGNTSNVQVQINSILLDVDGVDGEVVHIANTAETAYSVAEAITLIDAGEALDETVYVQGIVSQVDKFNTSYKSIQYWISDDGTTEKQLECYSGKGLEGADFESVDDIQEGATVIVKGTLTKYNETYEFTQNNELVSYVAPAAEEYSGIKLTFDRTGTGVADVAVKVADQDGNALSSVSATLLASSITSFRNAGSEALTRTTNSVLAPASGAGYNNTQGEQITYTFRIDNLNSDFAYNTAVVDVYALNGGGTAQNSDGTCVREWTIGVETGDAADALATFAEQAGNDICTVPDEDGGLHHKAWEIAAEASQNATAPLFVKVTLTRTADLGCFAGIGALELITVEAPEPEPAPAPLELTLNVERYPGMGYTADVATVDFAEAKDFLGVEELTADMLTVVNPDGSEQASTITDGWFNAEGVVTAWGENAAINVKFFEAIPDGKFTICDMNGADEVGKTYTVKWALTAGKNTVIYTINVTFVEKPAVDLKFEDLAVAETTSVELTSEFGKAYEELTADVDVAAILAALGVESLNDVTIYAVQSDGSLDDNYKLGTTDGWRNAAGDWQTWGADARFCVKTDFAGEAPQIWYVGGMDGQNLATDEPQESVTYTAKFAFVKNGSETNEAYVLNVNFTYSEPEPEPQPVEGDSFEGVIKQILTNSTGAVQGESTDEQTVTVAINEDGTASITFSGFTMPTVDTQLNEFTITGVEVTENEDGSRSFATPEGGVSVAVPRGNGFVNYPVTLEGTQADATSAPVLKLTVGSSTVDTVWYAATEKEVDEAIETAIRSLNANGVSGTIFDLSGRKVEKIQKGGVYIVNGKKVAVK